METTSLKNTDRSSKLSNSCYLHKSKSIFLQETHFLHQKFGYFS